MIGVIDVSGAMEILLQKEKAAKFGKVLEESVLLAAPDLFIPELTGAFLKYREAKIFSRDDCRRYIEDGINLVDKFIGAQEIWEEAFSEAANNGHSIYDMLYMVAARRTGGVLITGDPALAAICKKNHVQICH